MAKRFPVITLPTLANDESGAADSPLFRAFSGEVDTGSREENASRQKS